MSSDEKQVVFSFRALNKPADIDMHTFNNVQKEIESICSSINESLANVTGPHEKITIEFFSKCSTRSAALHAVQHHISTTTHYDDHYTVKMSYRPSNSSSTAFVFTFYRNIPLEFCSRASYHRNRRRNNRHRQSSLVNGDSTHEQYTNLVVNTSVAATHVEA
jgi:hypothetical protein